MAAGKIAPFVRPGGSAERDGAVGLADRDDDQLMLLVGGGLPAAFDELVRRHRRRMLGVAMRYVKNLALARDVTQNTFLEVYRSAPRYQPRGSFSSFLYRALLNQCRMARRAALSQARCLAAATVE